MYQFQYRRILRILISKGMQLKVSNFFLKCDILIFIYVRILPLDLGKYLLHFSVGIRFVIGELEKIKGHFEAGEQSFSFAHAPGKEDKEVDPCSILEV